MPVSENKIADIPVDCNKIFLLLAKVRFAIGVVPMPMLPLLSCITELPMVLPVLVNLGIKSFVPVPVTGLVKAFCLPLNVDQSVDVNIPLTLALALPKAFCLLLKVLQSVDDK